MKSLLRFFATALLLLAPITAHAQDNTLKLEVLQGGTRAKLWSAGTARLNCSTGVTCTLDPVNGRVDITASGSVSGANPSAPIGLSAVNGSASTFMRSDAAPALSQSITPTWTGQHTFAIGTITTSTPSPNITQTWNSSGITFTAIKASITNTASASGSLLMDLQVGGASQFSVRRDGVIFAPTLSTTGLAGNQTLTLTGNNTASVLVSSIALFSTSPQGLSLTSNGGVYFTNSTSNPNTTTVGGYDSPSAGVILANAGSNTTVGVFRGNREVVAKTANYTVVARDTGRFFTNAGASGEVDFTLPTAAAGLTYIFYVDAAQTLKVIAGASTTIRVAGSVSASAGNITNATTGGSIRLTAISTTQWVAEYSQGTWTVN
ncbi:MAG TPA: hypothetical protein VJ464_16840 [Blastocatellia bacterium]|nr:hypothetical protein [Blastocatellia bacterium]